MTFTLYKDQDGIAYIICTTSQFKRMGSICKSKLDRGSSEKISGGIGHVVALMYSSRQPKKKKRYGTKRRL